MLPRARRFDGGIQGQQIGLFGNFLHFAGEIGDIAGLLQKGLHGFAHGGDRLLDEIHFTNEFGETFITHLYVAQGVFRQGLILGYTFRGAPDGRHHGMGLCLQGMTVGLSRREISVKVQTQQMTFGDQFQCGNLMVENGVALLQALSLPVTEGRDGGL